MKGKNFLTKGMGLLLLTLLLGIGSHGLAATVTVSLDGVSVSQCGETWNEAGTELSFVQTTGEDCDGGGNCFFGVEPTQVWLFPSRLNVDLSGLPGNITGVEVDIIDNCGTGCTKAFIYQGNTQVDSKSNTTGTSETLILSPGAATIDRLAVSSCEGAVSEIRILLGPTIGPGQLPPWHAEAQLQLGWVFNDPINPQNSSPIPGWDKTIGNIPVWSYDADRTAWGQPGQWYIKIPNLDNDNPVKHFWISWVYDFDNLAPGTRIATNVDWSPFTDWADLGFIDEWFDSNGNPTSDNQRAAFGRFTWAFDMYPNPEYEEIWLGLFSLGYFAKEVYVKTICVDGCEGDIDGDGDVDGDDLFKRTQDEKSAQLKRFAEEFGRIDCE